MQRLIAVAVLTILGLAAAAHADGQQAASNDASFIAYDEFIRLGVQERAERFRVLTPDNKSLLIRTHAERWLTAHRNRLSVAQVAVVENAIAFVTPQLYAQPDNPDLVERESSLKQRLSCTLGRENARQAFKFDARGPAGVKQPSMIDSWLTWFADCVLPSIR
jgi:hypothetical protein